MIQVSQCMFYTQIKPFKCMEAGDNFGFKYRTSYPEVKNVFFSGVTMTTMFFHLQFTQPTLYNITIHVREHEKADRNYALVEWNKLRKLDGFPPQTQCEILPPADIRTTKCRVQFRNYIQCSKLRFVR